MFLNWHYLILSILICDSMARNITIMTRSLNITVNLNTTLDLSVQNCFIFRIESTLSGIYYLHAGCSNDTHNDDKNYAITKDFFYDQNNTNSKICGIFFCALIDGDYLKNNNIILSYDGSRIVNYNLTLGNGLIFDGQSFSRICYVINFGVNCIQINSNHIEYGNSTIDISQEFGFLTGASSFVDGVYEFFVPSPRKTIICRSFGSVSLSNINFNRPCPENKNNGTSFGVTSFGISVGFQYDGSMTYFESVSSLVSPIVQFNISVNMLGINNQGWEGNVNFQGYWVGEIFKTKTLFQYIVEDNTKLILFRENWDQFNDYEDTLVRDKQLSNGLFHCLSKVSYPYINLLFNIRLGVSRTNGVDCDCVLTDERQINITLLIKSDGLKSAICDNNNCYNSISIKQYFEVSNCGVANHPCEQTPIKSYNLTIYKSPVKVSFDSIPNFVVSTVSSTVDFQNVSYPNYKISVSTPTIAPTSFPTVNRNLSYNIVPNGFWIAILFMMIIVVKQ